MNRLNAGFARVQITPPLGLQMDGYYEVRLGEGIFDELYATAVVINDGVNTVALLSADVIGIDQKTVDIGCQMIAERCNIPKEAIFIACTHTHTGPVICTRLHHADDGYNSFFFRKLADAVVFAIEDLQPAEFRVADTKLKDISYIRRYRMKDGTIQTNPGVGNPDIAAPIGDPDETVQLIRIVRENAPEILMVNFQVHPDVIGGCKYSADYPKFVRDSLEDAIENVRCIYFNGAQGDTNHINVRTSRENANGGYNHSKHMGRSIAGAVLQIYGKAEPVSGNGVGFIQKNIHVPSNRGEKSQILQAEQIISLHKSGCEAQIPFAGMERVTVIAEAYRMKRLENGPDSFTLNLSAVRFGDIGIIGIPGEPFTEIGRQIKSNSPFKMTFVCCCTNGYEGYYPMQSAYDEGGYEARSSPFQAGVAEKIIAGSLEMLSEFVAIT